MELGVNTETVGSIGGTAGFISLIKHFYNDWIARLDKRDIQKRLDKQDEELMQHTIRDGEVYATKSEQRALFDHIDRKFDNLQKMIVDVIRSGNKRSNGGDI